LPPPFSLIIGGLWLAWVACWVILPRGKAIARKETALSQASYGVLLLVAAWLMSGVGVPPIFKVRLWPQSSAVLVIGTIIVVLGLAFAIWARRHLGANWSMSVSVKREHELIRSGPYRFVRHPIYTGILIAILGTGVTIGEWRAVVSLAFAFFSFQRKASLEERWMVETFGAAYEDYRAKVRALIPFVF
jgi:protein-S-isoprenylcysteine O-methyltransferase Ste14